MVNWTLIFQFTLQPELKYGKGKSHLFLQLQNRGNYTWPTYFSMSVISTMDALVKGYNSGLNNKIMNGSLIVKVSGSSLYIVCSKVWNISDTNHYKYFLLMSSQTRAVSASLTLSLSRTAWSEGKSDTFRSKKWCMNNRKLSRNMCSFSGRETLEKTATKHSVESLRSTERSTCRRRRTQDLSISENCITYTTHR